MPEVRLWVFELILGSNAQTFNSVNDLEASQREWHFLDIFIDTNNFKCVWFCKDSYGWLFHWLWFDLFFISCKRLFRDMEVSQYWHQSRHLKHWGGNSTKLQCCNAFAMVIFCRHQENKQKLYFSIYTAPAIGGKRMKLHYKGTSVLSGSWIF